MTLFSESGHRTRIMGILNMTPDSFYVPSRVPDISSAVARAGRMLAEGADILDVGAESTRPGSSGASLRHELDFLVPTVAAIHERFPDALISADTRRATAAREAVRAGASIINDVSGLELADEASEMLALLRESDAYYVLMHTKGTPDVMNVEPIYEDFWGELRSFFEERLGMIERAGIARGRIILDPGIGFGKSGRHNRMILANLRGLRAFGCPLLIGASRKAFIGQMLDAPPEERLEGTLAVSALCAWQGVEVVRVHDVEENRRAIRTIEAIRDERFL